MDYCNSLFFAASNELLIKMQRVQNCLARVVTGASWYSSSAPLLKILHWLPVESCIAFKTNLITYKGLNLSKPAYLSNTIHPREYNINLKANSSYSLKHRPKIKLWQKFIRMLGPLSMEYPPKKSAHIQFYSTFQKALKNSLFQQSCNIASFIVHNMHIPSC